MPPLPEDLSDEVVEVDDELDVSEPDLDAGDPDWKTSSRPSRSSRPVRPATSAPFLNNRVKTQSDPDCPVGDLRDEDGQLVGQLLPSHFDTTSLKNRISVRVPASTLVHPRSTFQGHEPPAPEVSEWKALRELLQLNPVDRESNYCEIELHQFCCYIDSIKYPQEMRSLHLLSSKENHGTMFFDGVLSYGSRAYFVRKIPFATLPIDNYGADKHTVGGQIWIMSAHCAVVSAKGGLEVYYRLKKPSLEYARFYVGFVWIVDLAKHVVDYLQDKSHEKDGVEFRLFKSDFYNWLLQRHGTSPEFIAWHQKFGQTDFRVPVHGYLDFIHKEAHGILEPDEVQSHRLWKEIRDYTAYKPDGHALVSKSTAPSHPPPTIVTPYTYELFRHLPCGDMIAAVSPSERTEQDRSKLIEKQRLEIPAHVHEKAKIMKSVPDALAEGLERQVCVGDVISIERDENDANWRRQKALGFNDVERWFGLVQKVYHGRTRYFDIIWIYRPVDTLCGPMRYPWNNELFLSDHCSCEDGQEFSKVKESEVLGIHQVEWGGSSTTDTEFFCRQTYLQSERRWITYRPEHRVCRHHREPNANTESYHMGDTVLVHLKAKSNRLEPCELREPPSVSSPRVRIRVLLRREEVEPDTSCRPNELVYAEQFGEVGVDRIYGRCIVRHFSSAEDVALPYDRDGVGNAFYILTRLVEENGTKRCVPFDETSPFPKTFRQGFDPHESFEKLKGFDLFCGGGNFGRGLEETGGIEMRWANDIQVGAIHTYMANVDDPGRVRPFLGSIDDLQRNALEGKFSENVPHIGEVDFVSGGSPCPGFSRLTKDKTTPQQRKNQSLVASFASFIDVYRPRFGLLENVVEIIESSKGQQQDVFLQLMCAIVGLGYQTHFFLLDAWTFGSPQSRSRVFLAFAAPGHRLPKMPLQSHLPAHPKARAIGRLSNGEPMFERVFIPTAFGPVSAATAFADLPDIMDGKAECCIKFPDHRQAYGVTKYVRAQLAPIPIQPWGMNLVSAYNGGKGPITEAELQAYPPGKADPPSKAFGRIFANRLVATVTTSPAPADRYVGRCLHWNQNRILSNMEIRRAQGFRDHEVILGDLRSQWKTVGNSVAREVALALGLSFREAWLGSLVKDDEIIPKVSWGKRTSSTEAELKTELLLLPGDVVTVPFDSPNDDWKGRRVVNDDFEPSVNGEEAVTSAFDSLDESEALSPLIPDQASTRATSVAESLLGVPATPVSTSRKRPSSVMVDLFAARLAKSATEGEPAHKQAKMG